MSLPGLLCPPAGRALKKPYCRSVGCKGCGLLPGREGPLQNGLKSRVSFPEVKPGAGLRIVLPHLVLGSQHVDRYMSTERTDQDTQDIEPEYF